MTIDTRDDARIVMTLDAGGTGLLAERQADELAALVGVPDHPRRRPALREVDAGHFAACIKIRPTQAPAGLMPDALAAQQPARPDAVLGIFLRASAG